MLRGVSKQFLNLHIAPPEDMALMILENMFLAGNSAATEQVRLAVHDSYRRLLAPAMETEIRGEAKKSADEEAIRVFAENLRELLMASPLGQKSVMAIDPGFRTGCKLVCLDRQGKLLDNATIYPHGGEKQ